MKIFLKKIDKLYPYLLLLIAAFMAWFGKETFFLSTVTLAGVLCVVLATRGNIWTYPVGLYNCVAYAYVAYSNGLYGEIAAVKEYLIREELK